MTPALILTLLQDALTPVVAAEKGRLFVSETPEETLSLLAVTPKQWRAILQWQGHDGDESTYGSSKVGKIGLIIQTARGLRADRGADAHQSPAGGEEKPILQLVAITGQWLRSLIFRDDSGQLRDDVQHHRSNGRHQAITEIGGDWLTIDDVQHREYQTLFSLRYTDNSIDGDFEAILLALSLPNGAVTRAELAGDGTTLAFSDATISTVYLAHLNGIALGPDRVTLDGDTATFTTPPQADDTILLVGAIS